jgi:hypothetical protein
MLVIETLLPVCAPRLGDGAIAPPPFRFHNCGIVFVIEQ